MTMSAMKNPLMAILWGALLVGAAASVYVMVAVDEEPATLSSFSSQSELERYIKDMAGAEYASRLTPVAFEGDASYEFSEGVDQEYSRTNVQVQGVDEGDTVKTDGEYIYIASYHNVTIIDAVPADQMSVVATLEAVALATPEEGVETSVSIVGLLLHGDRLAVIAQVNSWTAYYDDVSSIGWVVDNFPRTLVAVYDVSDASTPGLVGITGVSGWYVTSRCVEGTAYLVTNHYIYTFEEEYILPAVSTEDGGEQVDATDILYDPTASDASSFTNVLAMDIDTMGFSTLSVLTGFASTVYMSGGNLYLTYQKWTGDVMVEGGVAEPDQSDSATTAIHKVKVEGTAMEVTASGTVVGWLLNQFSMDERGGYLRVATTTSWEDRENAVYVLDSQLAEVGALEGLAPDETIYSARFMGDRLYLVTFLQTDPLFVIDLSDPASPRVLGELQMPGFSTYLHPVGDGLLLGVGMENWTMKVALYDVSDPENPVELGKYMTEGSSTYSPAQYDHKAVLFDEASGRLVLPVYSYSYDYYYTSAYGYWQGFYVLAVGADTGVELVGGIEHGSYCSRALTIGGTLYTVSAGYVLANDLYTLGPLGMVNYGDDWDYYDDVPVEAR